MPQVTCHVAGWCECSGELLEVGGRTLEVASEALAMARALAHQSCIGRALARHSAFNVVMAQCLQCGILAQVALPLQNRGPLSRGPTKLWHYIVLALYSYGPFSEERGRKQERRADTKQGREPKESARATQGRTMGSPCPSRHRTRPQRMGAAAAVLGCRGNPHATTPLQIRQTLSPRDPLASAKAGKTGGTDPN